MKKMQLEIFGNENDTFIVSKNGAFLVSSVDGLDGIEAVEELPKDVEPIDAGFFEELAFSSAELEWMFD